MKTRLLISRVWAAISIGAALMSAQGGTWSDHFSATALGVEWTGVRDAFRIVDSAVDGVSGMPLPPSPFNFVEIETDSTDCTVSAWVNIVMPNTRICTKGALVLRHAGMNGYVFALHEATQTAEVYRLENGAILLSKPWKIDLGTYYFARAELHGPTMTFFIDEQVVGTVSDTLSLSGAVGLAVQDVDSALFDDFTVTGPGVIGNVDDIVKPEVSTGIQTGNHIVLKFNAVSPYDYFIQVKASPEPSHDWQLIGTIRAKLDLGEVLISDVSTNTARFYRVEKVPCYCR